MSQHHNTCGHSSEHTCKHSISWGLISKTNVMRCMDHLHHVKDANIALSLNSTWRALTYSAMLRHWQYYLFEVDMQPSRVEAMNTIVKISYVNQHARRVTCIHCIHTTRTKLLVGWLMIWKLRYWHGGDPTTSKSETLHQSKLHCLASMKLPVYCRKHTLLVSLFTHPY